MTPPTFPLTAWEQAVIVVIFAVIALTVSGLAIGVMRWLLTWTGKRETTWQNFIRELRNLDIEERNKTQNRTDTTMVEVKRALTEMANAITGLTTEFHTHVVDEDARFDVLLTDAQKRKVKESRKKDERPPT